VEREAHRVVQRIFEMAAGVCASALGLLILFSFLSESFSGNGYTPFPLSHDLIWLPAFLAFAATLAAIALGPLLHGLPSLTRAGRRARMVCAWVGGLALWFSTLGLIVLIYLAGFSIGLAFIPSAVLALIACVLALIPGPVSGAHK
jgi:hypothetical protein